MPGRSSRQARVHEDGCLRLTSISIKPERRLCLGVDCARTRAAERFQWRQCVVADSESRVPGRAGSVDDVSVGVTRSKGESARRQTWRRSTTLTGRDGKLGHRYLPNRFCATVRPYDVSANDRAKDNPYCQRDHSTGEAAGTKGISSSESSPIQPSASQSDERSAIRASSTSRQRRPRTIGRQQPIQPPRLNQNRCEKHAQGRGDAQRSHAAAGV